MESLFFLCQNEEINYIFQNFGFNLRLVNPILNSSTSLIANHTITEGVWCVSVRFWSLRGYFEIYSPSLYPIVLASSS